MCRFVECLVGIDPKNHIIMEMELTIGAKCEAPAFVSSCPIQQFEIIQWAFEFFVYPYIAMLWKVVSVVAMRAMESRSWFRHYQLHVSSAFSASASLQKLNNESHSRFSVFSLTSSY